MTQWSINRLAARAVALYGSPRPHVPPAGLGAGERCEHCVEVLALLEEFGLVDDRRRIQPDDTREIHLTPPNDTVCDLNREDVKVRYRHSTPPPGLATLTPAADQPAADQPARPRQPRSGVRAGNVCGSLAGRSRHLRSHEPLCEACRAAYQTHRRAAAARKREAAARLRPPLDVERAG